jgi:hypothetical protein
VSTFGDGDERLFFNGITEDGSYVQEPLQEEELVQKMLAAPPDWVLPEEPDPRGTDDPTRRPRYGVNPMLLEESGWAVVWPTGVDPLVKRALTELLDLRATQADPFFRELYYRPGEDARAFLRRLNAPQGPADPARVPYYVLLVGDPQQIPFSFQRDLDQVYAVGRICFDQDRHYRTYAQSVLDVEEGRVRRRPEVSFFAPEHAGDRASWRTRHELVEPLMDYVAQPPESRAHVRNRPWKVHGYVGADATKVRLGRLLSAEDASALLFTGGHGMEAAGDEDRKRKLQGALLTHEWPGRGDVEEGHRFAASDLAKGTSCNGLIAFLFACYGVGTPTTDSFWRQSSPPRRIAEKPFVASLVRSLLACPAGGAQAVIGHVDRAWTTSFSWQPGEVQETTFQNVLDALLNGMPAGGACEWIGQHAADLATELARQWELKEQYGKVENPGEFARLRLAFNDARNFVLFGDPAVRLAVPGLAPR